MNDQAKNKTIEAIFKEAAEAVKGLPEHLQEKAFELAVSKISGESLLNKRDESTGKTEHKKNDEDFFQVMNRETGVVVDHLKSVYKIDKDGELKIVVSLTGKTSDKQRSLAYLYFLGMKLGFATEWVSALKFAERVKDYGSNDGHISKNLKRDKDNILQEGQKRGKEYALTPNGIFRAKELLRSFTQ